MKKLLNVLTFSLVLLSANMEAAERKEEKAPVTATITEVSKAPAQESQSWGSWILGPITYLWSSSAKSETNKEKPATTEVANTTDSSSSSTTEISTSQAVNTAANNTAIGSNALGANTTGVSNTSLGINDKKN